MDNRIANLITTWQASLFAANILTYNEKKEVFKHILEELAEYQNCFGANIWDISILGAFVRNLLDFRISNNIVLEKKDISESAAKVLEHFSKIEI